VLAGEHATGGDARLDDSPPPAASHPFEDAVGAAVEDDERVKVAVAGVEDVHHHQVVALGDGIDGPA
jgi:hypothetical protein